MVSEWKHIVLKSTEIKSKQIFLVYFEQKEKDIML